VDTVTDNPGTERADLIRERLDDRRHLSYLSRENNALRSIVDMAEQAYGDCGYYDPEDTESTDEHNPRRCMSHCDCGWGQLSAGFVLDEIGRILGVLPHGE
jgi:hypothetical protein